MVKPAAGLIAEQQDNGDLNQTPSRLRFTAASRLGESNARQVAAIYESSFSAAEREPINQLLSDIVTKRRTCYLGKAGNLVVAFAVCLPLTHGIEFLEYFAVERHHRNQRIGTRLFRHMVTDIASRFRRGVIFEVEDPAMGTRTEAATRWARIRFYQKLGAEVVACAPLYQAPPSRGNSPLHYLLMWMAIAQRAKVLNGPELRRCVLNILVSAYGLSENDPLVQQVLSDLKC